MKLLHLIWEGPDRTKEISLNFNRILSFSKDKQGNIILGLNDGDVLSIPIPADHVMNELTKKGWLIDTCSVGLNVPRGSADGQT